MEEGEEGERCRRCGPEQERQAHLHLQPGVEPNSLVTVVFSPVRRAICFSVLTHTRGSGAGQILRK